MRDGATPGRVTPPLTSNEDRTFEVARKKVTVRTAIVYGLFSPAEPDAIRYVGFTTQRLRARLKAHWTDARKGRQTPVAVWVADQFSAGLRVEVLPLKFDATFADEIEIIAKLRSEGADLLNQTNGGMGTNGRPLTDKMMAAFSAPASEKQRDWVRQFNATRDYSARRPARRATTD